MGNGKIGYFRQLWYTLKWAIHSWIEWQDAKEWARECRPAWHTMATKARREETRVEYKRKILAAYRGHEDA